MLVDPCSVIMTMYCLSDPCQGLTVDKKIFLFIHKFYTLYPKVFSPWGWGSWNLKFLVSLPYICYIPNLVKIGQVDVNGRRTANANSSIYHRSNSGDLKLENASKQPMCGSTAQQNELSIKFAQLKNKFSFVYQTNQQIKKKNIFIQYFLYNLFNITVSFSLVWCIISFHGIGNDFCCKHLSYLQSTSTYTV